MPSVDPCESDKKSLAVVPRVLKAVVCRDDEPIGLHLRKKVDAEYATAVQTLKGERDTAQDTWTAIRKQTVGKE